MKNLIIGVFALMLFSTVFIKFKDQSTTSTVANCTVTKLQHIQILSGSGDDMSTEVRYLVITDKETFICKNSILNGKFNNSDIFWRLKEGGVYDFKVCGLGKGVATDYRNILEASLIYEK